MITQDSKIANVQKSVWVKQSTQLSPPQLDESYFEKLAAFGLACFAAAIVGKLVMTALTPKQTSGSTTDSAPHRLEHDH